jgi:hypothetical protein
MGCTHSALPALLWAKEVRQDQTMTAITQINAAHSFHLMPSSMPFIIFLAEATKHHML